MEPPLRPDRKPPPGLRTLLVVHLMCPLRPPELPTHLGGQRSLSLSHPPLDRVRCPRALRKALCPLLLRHPRALVLRRKPARIHILYQTQAALQRPHVHRHHRGLSPIRSPILQLAWVARARLPIPRPLSAPRPQANLVTRHPFRRPGADPRQRVAVWPEILALSPHLRRAPVIPRRQ